MEVLEQSDPLDIYFKNYTEAEEYLALYGTDGTSKNKGVTLSYAHVAKFDPLFIWFSAATLGSAQVGRTIGLADNLIFRHCSSTQTLAQGFAWGNQAIHNNIMALYHIYKDTGMGGLEKLLENDPIGEIISKEALSAFKVYSQIETQVHEYAKTQHLSPNNLDVIKHILNQPGNLAALKAASLELVAHEQIIVSPMYKKSFFIGYKTVGEVLSDVNFIEKLVADGFELSGAKILDKYVSVKEYDFNSYEDRMAYFGKVFDEYFGVLSEEGGLEKLLDQTTMLIQSLDLDYIPYGDHFIDPHNPHDFAFYYDIYSYCWKIIPGFELPDLNLGVPYGRGKILLPVDHPVKVGIFFYEADTESVYGINFPTLDGKQPVLKDEDSNGSWTLLKNFWWGPCDNCLIAPKEHLLWLRDESVKKAALLSWLGNYVIEDPDFILPDPISLQEYMHANETHVDSYKKYHVHKDILENQSIIDEHSIQAKTLSHGSDSIFLSKSQDKIPLDEVILLKENDFSLSASLNTLQSQADLSLVEIVSIKEVIPSEISEQASFFPFMLPETYLAEMHKPHLTEL